MKKQVKLGAVLALSLLITTPVFSHDYWLKPEAFFAQIGASLRVRLYVGDDFKIGEERPLQKARTVRFEMFSDAREPEDLLAEGQDNQTPVTQLQFKSDGNYLIAMERKAQRITLDAKKFTDYLAEEGLDSIITRRRQGGESDKPGRERYSRYLKSLVQIGARHNDSYRRVLNQRLEIIPQSNPYELQRGNNLKVRVLFEGKPLAGAKVFAYNRNNEAIHEQGAQTSNDGMVVFKLDQPGEWLVRLVYMRRCENCADADWESFWGAYSFGMK